MKIPKQHHTHKRKAPMRTKTPKDKERYQALLMHWFREEPALDYELLTGEEAEKALQDLMTATIDVGLHHPNGAGNYGEHTRTDGVLRYWLYRHTYNSLKNSGVI